ncbi:MAG: hypothetical protein L7S72_00340 [Flavobacteriales bacterium]|nr:hypothetical protein [Flavobacteriales bacterium]
MKYNHNDLKVLIPMITHLIKKTEDDELISLWKDFGHKFEVHDEYTKPAEAALMFVMVFKWAAGIAVGVLGGLKLLNII